MIEYREFNGRFRHPAFKGLLRADPTIVPLPRSIKRRITARQPGHARIGDESVPVTVQM